MAKNKCKIMKILFRKTCPVYIKLTFLRKVLIGTATIEVVEPPKNVDKERVGGVVKLIRLELTEWAKSKLNKKMGRTNEK